MLLIRKKGVCCGDVCVWSLKKSFHVKFFLIPVKPKRMLHMEIAILIGILMEMD